MSENDIIMEDGLEDAREGTSNQTLNDENVVTLSGEEDAATDDNEGDGVNEEEDILEFLRSQPNTEQAAIAGSYRRGKEILHDLDFIVSTKSPESIIHSFANMDTVAEIISNGSSLIIFKS